MRQPPALNAALRAVVACAALLLGACATTPAVPPLSPAQIVELSKQGQAPEQIIAEIRRTRTILNLSASDFVRLHEAGVAPPVLDYLQRSQLEEMLWRERFYNGPYGPFGTFGPPGAFNRGFYDCPGPYRVRRAPFC